MQQKTTEKIVREVLGKTYNEFGFQDNVELIAEVVGILDDPNPSMTAVVNEDTASFAATEIRNLLWSTYSDVSTSANATANLFSTLNRNEELGWLDEHISS